MTTGVNAGTTPPVPDAAAAAAADDVPAAASSPATLDHAGIAARVPHHGSMCLLHSLLDWDATQIRCSVVSHADPGNPLRHAGRLPAPCAIEYAAQAMALHSALSAHAGGAVLAQTGSLLSAQAASAGSGRTGSKQPAPAGSAPTPGFLASARQVRLHVARLDDVPGAITVHAVRLAGAEQQALYRFSLLSAASGALLVEGRATVVLNTPLPAPAVRLQNEDRA